MMNFALTQGLTHMLQLGLGWVLGQAVLSERMRVHDTRKLMHFCLFLAPIAIGMVLQHDRTPAVFVLSGVSFLLSLLVLVEPIRRRIPVLRTAFAAVDRPEDRPYSLAWMVTQLLGDYAAMVVCTLWLLSYGQVPMIAVVAMAICFGDGLAEPVGVRWGRHRYAVPSLVRGRRYHRSIEGSAVVFAATVVVVLIAGWLLPPGTLIPVAARMPLLILLPVSMTLAEALAPHTWDGPVMYLTGGATLVAALEWAGPVATG